MYSIEHNCLLFCVGGVIAVGGAIAILLKLFHFIVSYLDMAEKCFIHVRTFVTYL